MEGPSIWAILFIISMIALITFRAWYPWVTRMMKPKVKRPRPSQHERVWKELLYIIISNDFNENLVATAIRKEREDHLSEIPFNEFEIIPNLKIGSKELDIVFHMRRKKEVFHFVRVYHYDYEEA